jgi:hypothetical protein
MTHMIWVAREALLSKALVLVEIAFLLLGWPNELLAIGKLLEEASIVLIFCFKAYPTCFSHVHLPSIIAMISKTSVARDIITARSAAAAPAASGGGLVGMNAITRHGVRAKVFVYPEGLCSVWLMIAVCYFENKK